MSFPHSTHPAGRLTCITEGNNKPMGETNYAPQQVRSLLKWVKKQNVLTTQSPHARGVRGKVH